MFGTFSESDSGAKGYVGMFWGTVLNEDGSKLKGMMKYGDEMVKTNQASDILFDVTDGDQTAWEIINDDLSIHITKHIGNVDQPYSWQCGFGGDEMDGCLDFWLPTKIACPPDMQFEINGKMYIMKFKYSDDESDLSSEEQDKDDDY
jgi:hypothetical protein